ncbi:hypothetical protein PIB30_101126, partial [Stylosanthes scabra]|nr:hypothetical protein [Stylosanthes scabra]
MDPDKKGMSLDMYFKVHGVNLDEEEDEEEEEDTNDEGKPKKKTRGKTTCKKLHHSYFKDQEKVEFYKGQPIGPTQKVVSSLRQFVGTVVRNPQWVTDADFQQPYNLGKYTESYQ